MPGPESAPSGHPDPEDCKQDQSYEARVANEHKPKAEATHDDKAFYDILLNNLQKSRDERGYGGDRCHDDAVISGWKQKYHRQ